MVVDWITLRDMLLMPLLSCNVKMNRGFHNPVTGTLLCPAGLDWRDAEWVLPTHFFLILMVDLMCVWSLPVGNWLFVVINGQCWSMQTQSTTPKTLGMVFSEPASYLNEFHSFMCNLYITSSNWTGIQAHLHLTQLCGEGSESNQIWKCSDAWHEAGHHGFSSIWSDTSAFSRDVPLLCYWSSGSSDFYCHPPQSFAELTLPQTQKDSMIVFWTSWMMFTNCWTDGIGECSSWVSNFVSKLMLWFLDSQIFPSYIICEHAVTKISELAKLKEKRAVLRQQNLGAWFSTYYL